MVISRRNKPDKEKATPRAHSRSILVCLQHGKGASMAKAEYSETGSRRGSERRNDGWRVVVMGLTYSFLMLRKGFGFYREKERHSSPGQRSDRV